MGKSITIMDKEYKDWILDLSQRYRRSQIKAAVKVNMEKLLFNWQLGRDIVEMHVEERWGEKVITQLSKDLRLALPGVEGLSRSNIYYCKNFYLLYSQDSEIVQQVIGQLEGKTNASTSEIVHQLEGQFADNIFVQQVVGLFQIPWGHHCTIIDKVKGDRKKALFFVRKTIEEGWSRGVLETWIATDLYNREGKAITNFHNTLPEPMSDLASEITKDPYNFAFAGIRGKYNERLLKDALLKNITDFLLELGTGFSYVGKEYRLQIGETENFIDLLFFHIPLNCYVVIEVKIDKFTPGDLGQLGTYVVACNHILKQSHHNPTIGLLVCKSKDNLLAQYALESSNQPIGISEFELEKLYPTKVEGMIPTIEELEDKLNDRLSSEEKENPSEDDKQ
ncbi:MAG: PDDEXK nuclease domain-containing protein [Bacteroidales bacterium]|nr:PDDEXK nuclease domain-containing protein [Bacteroidales bacterium]